MVDIEQFYYDELLAEFEKLSKNNRDSIGTIEALNTQFEEIKIELEKYLVSQLKNYFIDNINRTHLERLIKLFIKIETPLKDWTKIVGSNPKENPPKNIMFLNFNYTNTVLNSIRLSGFISKNHHIHIHGSINELNNPIIFGYGDDTDDEFKLLEKFGNNEILRMIKSNYYSNTQYYHNMLKFIDDIDYEIFVVGHSCGLSDRTLLKTIFEHKNCTLIKSFHYNGNEGDFYNRMQISRHFENKVKARERILSYDSICFIPQNSK